MSQHEKNQAEKIEAQNNEVEDLEVTAKESEHVKGGKVAMQDFHFVMRNNSASPK